MSFKQSGVLCLAVQAKNGECQVISFYYNPALFLTNYYLGKKYFTLAKIEIRENQS